MIADQRWLVTMRAGAGAADESGDVGDAATRPSRYPAGRQSSAQGAVSRPVASVGLVHARATDIAMKVVTL